MEVGPQQLTAAFDGGDGAGQARSNDRRNEPDPAPEAPESDARIVNDLILPGCADTENWNEINNKCGPGRALSGAVGILFQRPESVRRALANARCPRPVQSTTTRSVAPVDEPLSITN